MQEKIRIKLLAKEREEFLTSSKYSKPGSNSIASLHHYVVTFDLPEVLEDKIAWIWCTAL